MLINNNGLSVSLFSTYKNKIESINQNFATEEKSGKLISLSNQMKVDFLIKSYPRGSLIKLITKF